jgi:hypothetical protein
MSILSYVSIESMVDRVNQVEPRALKNLGRFKNCKWLGWACDLPEAFPGLPFRIKALDCLGQ